VSVGSPSNQPLKRWGAADDLRRATVLGRHLRPYLSPNQVPLGFTQLQLCSRRLLITNNRQQTGNNCVARWPLSDLELLLSIA
jgi:hypothetical protein